MADSKPSSRTKAPSVASYIAALPPDRRKALSTVRKVMRASLPKGVKERMNWGMIAYEVPLKTYPETYNGQPLLFAAIASQKNHMAVYLTCLYMDKKREKAFRAAYKAEGKRLDMGKSCLRFKKLEDLAMKALAKNVSSITLKDFIRSYEATHG